MAEQKIGIKIGINIGIPGAGKWNSQGRLHAEI